MISLNLSKSKLQVRNTVFPMHNGVEYVHAYFVILFFRNVRNSVFLFAVKHSNQPYFRPRGCLALAFGVQRVLDLCSPYNSAPFLPQ